MYIYSYIIIYIYIFGDLAVAKYRRLNVPVFLVVYYKDSILIWFKTWNAKYVQCNLNLVVAMSVVTCETPFLGMFTSDLLEIEKKVYVYIEIGDASLTRFKYRSKRLIMVWGLVL